MSQIDTIDERILAELQDNGRLTMKALAERVGLSSPAMIERVRRLELRGVIAGYRAIVDPAALGRIWTAHISVRVSQSNQDAFVNVALDEPAISALDRVTGAFTHILRAHLADPNDLAGLLDRLGATGAECESALVLDSPLPWRAVTPPAGSAQDRARPTRRRRRVTATASAVADEPTIDEPTPDEAASKPRRPGRPRRRTNQAPAS